MVAYFALGLVTLVGALYGLRWLTQVDAAVLARFIKYGGIAIAAIIVILLALTGRIWLLLLLGAPAIGLWRQWQRRKLAESIGASRQGRTSGIETGYLSVTLDHDSGTVDGRIKAGKFRDRRLADLTLPDLLDLLEEVRASDGEGVPVLEAYLDRLHGDWREAPSGEKPQAGSKSNGTMTREEAFEVLGLAPGASIDDIRDAHRRLMMKVHPDHGGSSYLAARLNEARDRLLVN
jgi:DnaJ-like protein